MTEIQTTHKAVWVSVYLLKKFMENREIRFRAWDDKLGEMFIPQRILYAMDGDVFLVDDDGTCRGHRYYLMQYTGLKDRNGIAIYKGDIVRDCDTSDLEFEVKWDSIKVGYYMPPEFDDEYVYSINSVKLEIIGNIYENPELLDKAS